MHCNLSIYEMHNSHQIKCTVKLQTVNCSGLHVSFFKWCHVTCTRNQKQKPCSFFIKHWMSVSSVDSVIISVITTQLLSGFDKTMRRGCCRAKILIISSRSRAMSLCTNISSSEFSLSSNIVLRCTCLTTLWWVRPFHASTCDGRQQQMGHNVAYIGIENGGALLVFKSCLQSWWFLCWRTFSPESLPQPYLLLEGAWRRHVCLVVRLQLFYIPVLGQLVKVRRDQVQPTCCMLGVGQFWEAIRHLSNHAVHEGNKSSAAVICFRRISHHMAYRTF